MIKWAQITDEGIILLNTLPSTIDLPRGGKKLLQNATEEELKSCGIYSYELNPPTFDADTEWRVGPSVTFNGNEVTATYEIIPKTEAELASHLEAKKAGKLAELASSRYDEEIGGMDFSGMTIRTDRESQALVTGAALKATSDNTYVCRWKTTRGFVELTASEIIAVADAVRDHVQSSFDKEATLIAQVEAATTFAELEAITW